MELTAQGQDVVVVTRPGRELGAGQTPVFASPARKGRIAAHRAVVQTAAQRIRDLRPDWVVVQNDLLPTLERPVFKAALQVGAKVAVVVHDGRLHTLSTKAPESGWFGTFAPPTRWSCTASMSLPRCDATPHVATSSSCRCRCRSACCPTPARARRSWTDAKRCGGADISVSCGGTTRARRSSQQLAARGVDGWRFAVLGAGAETSAGVHSVPGYLESGDLVAAVSATTQRSRPTNSRPRVPWSCSRTCSVRCRSPAQWVAFPRRLPMGSTGSSSRLVPTWKRGIARSQLSATTSTASALSTAGVARAWADHASVRGGHRNALRWKPERSSARRDRSGDVEHALRARPGPTRRCASSTVI